MPRLTRATLTTALVHAIQETRAAREPYTPRNRGHQRITDDAILRKKARQDWKARWDKEATRPRGHHPPATWTTLWSQDRRMLYAGLSKAEATALFLMRVEVIGLNAWLAAIGTLDTHPIYPYGWYT